MRQLIPNKFMSFIKSNGSYYSALCFIAFFSFFVSAAYSSHLVVEVAEDEFGNQIPTKLHSQEIQADKPENIFIVGAPEKITMDAPSDKSTSIPSGSKEQEETTQHKKMGQNADLLGLSIDGGGFRGLMPALWLQKLEEKIQQTFGVLVADRPDRPVIQLADVYDCVGGTSIGGMAALAIVHGYSAAYLVDMLQSEKESVFPKAQEQSWWYLPDFISSWIPKIENAIARKYDHKPLEGLLQSRFKAKLEDAKTDVLITACGVDGHPYLFNNSGKYKSLESWKIARSTSAAPTYFDAYNLTFDNCERHLVDGGIWCNNPAPLVAAHLMKSYDAPATKVHILSLGTGNAPVEKWIPASAGQVKAAGPLIDSLMASHSRGNHFVMDQFFEKNYCRINPSLIVPIELDNISKQAIALLSKLAEQEMGAVESYFNAHKGFMLQKLVRDDPKIASIVGANPVFRDMLPN